MSIPRRSLFATTRLVKKRQLQMLRLMERYSRLIEEPTSWILPYSWNIGYVDQLDPTEVHYQEFFCNTNNIVFAAMIFEAQKLTEGKKITIANIDFNSLVKR